MKRSAFAVLIGVSKQQVSKYAAAGAIAEVDGVVDAARSLDMLEGRLDEAKRRRALETLASELGSRIAPQAHQTARIAVPTAKQEKDAVERDLKLLEYGQKAGDLVLAADVDDAARTAITEMREAFANGSRDLANDICAAFGLAPEKATPLRRQLGVGFERALGRFSERMTALALSPAMQPGADTPPPIELSA